LAQNWRPNSENQAQNQITGLDPAIRLPLTRTTLLFHLTVPQEIKRQKPKISPRSLIEANEINSLMVVGIGRQ